MQQAAWDRQWNHVFSCARQSYTTFKTVLPHQKWFLDTKSSPLFLCWKMMGSCLLYFLLCGIPPTWKHLPHPLLLPGWAQPKRPSSQVTPGDTCSQVTAGDTCSQVTPGAPALCKACTPIIPGLHASLHWLFWFYLSSHIRLRTPEASVCITSIHASSFHLSTYYNLSSYIDMIYRHGSLAI